MRQYEREAERTSEEERASQERQELLGELPERPAQASLDELADAA